MNSTKNNGSGERSKAGLNMMLNLKNLDAASLAKAEKALRNLREISGFCEKHASLAPDAELVWRYILSSFAEAGRAPSLGEIVKAYPPFSEKEVKAALLILKKKDLIHMNIESFEILAAYPFSSHKTSYRLSIGGRQIYAMCAVDALGIPSLLKCDAEIHSKCAHCEESINLAISEGGCAISYVNPTDSLVWIGYKYGDSCAASSLCTVLTFFDSRDHLNLWLEVHPNEKGDSLTLLEGLYVGQRLFKDLLNPERASVAKAEL